MNIKSLRMLNYKSFSLKLLYLAIIILITNNKTLCQCEVKISFCPGDFNIVDCDNSGDEILHWPQVIANQNGFCNNFQLKQTLGPIIGSLVPNGQYLIQYQAQELDAQGNVIIFEVCNFTIFVIKDTQSPHIVNCPPNLTVNGTINSLGNCCAIVNWPQPYAIDNCNLITILNQSNSCGSIFCDINNNINYEFIDKSGNKTNCNFNINVDCSTNNQELRNNKLGVYIKPNPSYGNFNLNLSRQLNNESIIKIIDISGKLVLIKFIQAGSNRINVEMPINFKGIFYIQLYSEGILLNTEKIIIM